MICQATKNDFDLGQGTALLLAGVAVASIVELIVLPARGSLFWLGLMYGVAVYGALPMLLVGVRS